MKLLLAPITTYNKCYWIVTEICKTTTNKTVDVEPLKRKLSEVLSEGLLDSVLPYLMHNTVTTVKKSVNKILGKCQYYKT